MTSDTTLEAIRYAIHERRTLSLQNLFAIFLKMSAKYYSELLERLTIA